MCSMPSVLTYNPATMRNEFLPYTERTVHTDHGAMYRVTTASGHSIVVTDDHSLATVGEETLFSPLPPEEALGKLLPIAMYMYDGGDECYEDDEDFVVDERMVTATAPSLCLVLFRYFSQHASYEAADDKELALLTFGLSRCGICHTINGRTVTADLYSSGCVPEGESLVPREEASQTNPYAVMPYTWSPVVSVENVEREDTTYDFTVPDFPLFIGNLILVYDTMQVHVPVTEAARTEALDKMLPSKNLFSVRTGDPMMLPQQESIFGLFQASKPSQDKPVGVSNIEKLKLDIEHGVLKPNTPVQYNGRKTTAGLVLVNDLLPDKYRSYDAVWDKKHVSKVLAAIGKESPGMYTTIADGFKELGAEFSYKLGVTFKASDFDLKELKASRDVMLKGVDAELASIEKSKLPAAEKYKKKVDVLRKAQSFNQKLTENATYNAFNQWSYSGAKGSAGQVMQIIASPTIVADPRDKVIPIPIRKSYNEGLSPAEYWVSSYGTRKGTVSAKLAVAPGGMMAKEVVGNTLDIVISQHDCKSKEGVVFPITDTKDLIGRYELGTSKLISAAYLESLLHSGKTSVTVRSPMKCKAKHGVCQVCFGLNENGRVPEIGNNVGVQSAQAISEPFTQMALSAKHTAGTAAEESVGLATVQRFYTMPNQYAGAALIAANTGTVTRIEPAPAGGTDIYIENKKHHAVPGRKIFVTVGAKVSAGDILTSGVPNLAKIVPHKGIDYGRELFVSHADDLYRRAGAPSLRKNFEVVARGLVNYVQIVTPGDFGFTEGEIVDYNLLQATIHEHPEKQAPTFKPIQRGTTYAPQDKPDFLANFAFKYLKKNIIENAALGAKSDVHSYHPVPGYAAATQFGKGKDGRY